MSTGTAAKPRSEDRRADEGVDRAAALARNLMPVAVVLAAVAAGAALGPAAAILVLAAGALVAVIAILWASLRTFLGETPLAGADAYALGAPRAEEEQKRALLRALKDLEFERGVGKISDEDYDALVARYRDDYKRLMRALEASTATDHARVRALIDARLEAAGLGSGEAGEPAEAAPEAAPTTAAPRPKGRRRTSGAPKGEGAAVTCAACRAANDADAVFCKKCGAKVAAAAEAREGDGEDTPA
jgi:hypothetical protein